ncbi:MAG TPA: ABC transporter ATP-binding protein [Caulobacteraceae bacterium]
MIELEAVRKAWTGGPSIGPLTLSIAAGTFVALLGGSGAGKTTTLKMINGLVEPDSGAVRVAGRASNEEPVHLRRRRIGYVFQEIGLFPHMTVAENIAVGPSLASWPKDRTAARIAELLALTALPSDAGGRMPAEFSGGQRQRVGLARALAAEPKVMLMDEPFGALDPIVREGLGRDYRALHESLGLTTVLVTHDVTEALLLADRIVVMDAGQIIADDTPTALLKERQEPAVRALMETPRRQARAVEALAQGGDPHE